MTNVWNDARGFTFWGTDGQSWIVADGPDARAIWDRLRAQTSPDARPAVPLVAAGPSLLVNPRHFAHASVVEGKLRLLMSNGTLPVIEAPADAAAARRALQELAKAKNE